MAERLKDLEVVEEEDRKLGRENLKEEELKEGGADLERPRVPTAGDALLFKSVDEFDVLLAKKFDCLKVCIPLQTDEEATDVASFLSIFGSSSQEIKVTALKMVELSDNGLADDMISVPRNGLNSHDFAVANDSALSKIASYSRLVASAQIDCAVRVSNVKDFASEVSAIASSLRSHMITLPLHRKADGTLADDFEDVDYVHYVLGIAQSAKSPYAMFLDARSSGLISRSVFGQRICIVHNEACGLELLALARHLLAKKNTHVDVIIMKDIKGINDNSAYAIVEDPKDGIALTKSAFLGEHSSVTFHHIPDSDDNKEILSFIKNENDKHAFTLVMFGGDNQVPMGFVDVTTFFGSLGHALLEIESIHAALLVMQKPLMRTVDHTTSSRSIIPSFLLANGPKEMVLVGEAKRSQNTNYSSQQGNQSNLSKIFTPSDLVKIQEKASALDAEKKTHNL